MWSVPVEDCVFHLSNCCHLKCHKVHGFTAIELLVSIAVLAILLTLAAPNLSQFVSSNRLTSQANSLVGDILLARSESATRGTQVVLCTSTTGTGCSSTAGWSDGWIVFSDTNNNAVVDSGEAILKSSSALDSASLTEAGSANKLAFRPYGGLNPAASKDFKLCSTSSSTGRQIFLAATGRPRVTKVPCP